MPPASLPAFAAMRPGPSSESSTTTRNHGPLPGRSRDGPRRMRCKVPAAYIGLLPAQEAEVAPPAMRQHDLEHVVDGDHPDDVLVLVDDRSDGEVEVGHRARNLLEIGVDPEALHRLEQIREA